MSEINNLEIQFARALDRLRNAMAARGGAPAPDAGPLEAKLTSLEADKARLLEELVAVRTKRDKDISALDDLISQLKPLIEEA